MSPTDPTPTTEQAKSAYESTTYDRCDDLYGVSDSETSKRPTAITHKARPEASELLSSQISQAQDLVGELDPHPEDPQNANLGPEGSMGAAEGVEVPLPDKLNTHPTVGSRDDINPTNTSVTRTVEARAETAVEEPGKVNCADQKVYIPPHLRIPKAQPAKVAEGVPSPEGAISSSGPVKPDIEASEKSFTPAMKEAEADYSHLPPHLRPPKVKKTTPAVHAEVEAPIRAPAVSDTVTDDDRLHRIMANQPSLSSGESKGKSAVANDTLATNVNGAASNLTREPTAKSKKATKLERIMIAKGWSPAPKGPIRPEGGWYEDEVKWEEREQHNHREPEHLAALESWIGDRLQETPSQAVFTDTSSPGFVLGTDLPAGELLQSNPTEDRHATHRPADAFTIAKANKTAQQAMDEFQREKKPERSPPRKFTKQEKQQAREAWRQRKEYYLEMERNHPNKPNIDIYIRRAESNDLDDITKLYNWYIENTCIALELKAMETAQWQARMDQCRQEGFEMFVAVLKLGKGEGHNRQPREPVCGFGYANDFGGPAHAYRFTAEIKVYVSHEYPHVGIGRCLFDRMMAVVDLNYCQQGGVEWRGPPMELVREISRIYVEIPYFEDDPEEKKAMEWKKDWLCGVRGRGSMRFEHYATQPGFGFKHGKR